MLTDLTASGGHPVPGVTSRGFVSIDHAAWFQRPLRGDEWTYFGVETVTRTGRQAVIRGTLAGPDRRPAASMAQEIILPTS
jgi:acyl-CoA thioesterase